MVFPYVSLFWWVLFYRHGSTKGTSNLRRPRQRVIWVGKWVCCTYNICCTHTTFVVRIQRQTFGHVLRRFSFFFCFFSTTRSLLSILNGCWAPGNARVGRHTLNSFRLNLMTRTARSCFYTTFGLSQPPVLTYASDRVLKRLLTFDDPYLVVSHLD